MTNYKHKTYDCRGVKGPDGLLELSNPEAATIDEIVEALNRQHKDVEWYVIDGHTISYKKLAGISHVELKTI